MAEISRRHVLGGAATVAIGLPLLAACAGGGGTDEASRPPKPKGGGLVATKDVPVGSAVILADDGLIVAQPSEGKFVGYTTICTHQRCPITQVDGKDVVCPCHGSRFDMTNGAEPESGSPASAPLPTVAITVKNGVIDRA